MVIDIKEICSQVLKDLSNIGYEKNEKEKSKFSNQLIFPKKYNKTNRISEQELRFLFIEKFKALHPKLFYSVETPTQQKYKFGKNITDIKPNVGRSASLDMCIFEPQKKKEFKRKLNIEFKFDNVSNFKIQKDFLKLINEDQNGAFIHLLKNTDSGTLSNSNKNAEGVFNKYIKALKKFEDYWSNESKTIILVIFSLEQNTFIHREITKTEIYTVEDAFGFKDKFGDITKVKNLNGWYSSPYKS